MLLGAPPLAKVAAANAEAFRRAVVAKDVGWFERTFAPSYVQRDGGRAIPRGEALAVLRKGLLKAPIAGLSVRVVSARSAAKGYEATLAFRGTMQGDARGLPVTLVAMWRDDQRWGLAKGRWLLLSTRTYGFERTVNAR